MFPGANADLTRDARIEDSARAWAQARGLFEGDPWLDKVTQLGRVVSQRHGVMLLGSSGSGKSTLLRALQAARASVSAADLAMLQGVSSYAGEESSGKEEGKEEGERAADGESED